MKFSKTNQSSPVTRQAITEDEVVEGMYKARSYTPGALNPWLAGNMFPETQCYEGKSISKLQIVIEEKRMGIVTYKQHLCEQPVLVATASKVTIMSARIMSSTRCKVAGVAISTGRPTRCSSSTLFRPS